MSDPKKYVTVALSDGTIVKMEVNDNEDDRFEKVSRGGRYSFDNVKNSIVSYAKDMREIWDQAKPDKLSVEFGVEMEASTEKTLMAVFVNGKGKGSMTVTLEWERDKSEKRKDERK